MPFIIRKAPKRDLYWVVNKETGRHMSKDPIPRERAEAQRRALYASEDREKLKGGLIDRITFENRQKKGAYPRGLTYDKYVAAENAQRMTIDNEIARLNQTNAEYEAAVAADPSLENVWCKIGSNIEPTRGEITTMGECLRRHKAYSDKLNPANKVFRPLVEGLTAVGDVAADLLSETPGIGSIASQVYQSFAPPGSKFRGSGTFRVKFLKRHSLPDKSYSLAQLSKISSVPLHILREVFNRGIGAYKTQPKSVRLKGSFVKNVDAPMSKKLTKEQWAMARVYSFLEGNPKHDEDLRRNVEGAGVLGTAWRAVKGAVGKVVGRVKDVARGVRLDYAPSIRNLLPTIGDKPIVEAYVRRDPIRAPLNTAINLLTLGRWNEVRRKYNYDKLFHLGLEVVIQMSDETRILARYILEKNEVINITQAKATDSQTQMMKVPLPTEGSLTINDLLAGGQTVLGPKWFPYDAFDNNCQDFIIAILQGSGILNPDLAKFVKQPLEQVMAGLPGYTQKLARLATDAGAIFNVALHGRGGLNPMPAFEKQLRNAGINPKQYLAKARMAAKKAGLAHEYLGFSDDDTHKLQIPNEEGKIIRFGRVGYGDFLFYTLSDDPKAAEHRKSYRTRATKIRGNWAKDAYSPNSLALGVLW